MPERRVRLVPATGSGVEWVHRLLDSAGLPTADLDDPRTSDEDGPALYVAVADGGAGSGAGEGTNGPGRVGCIGIERAGDAGLLRSAAIREGYRGEGYGAAMVRALETEARDAGIEALYLLTTTAAEFFENQGYEPVERRDVPVELKGSREFSDLCPASAAVLRKRL